VNRLVRDLGCLLHFGLPFNAALEVRSKRACLYNNSDTTFWRHVSWCKSFMLWTRLSVSFSMLISLRILEELFHGVGGAFCSLTVGLGRNLQESEGDGTIFVNVAVTVLATPFLVSE
jgi:hypothetical protein